MASQAATAVDPRRPGRRVPVQARRLGPPRAEGRGRLGAGRRRAPAGGVGEDPRAGARGRRPGARASAAGSRPIRAPACAPSASARTPTAAMRAASSGSPVWASSSRPGVDLAAGVGRAALPGGQLGQRPVQQAVQPPVAHLVAPGPGDLEVVAGPVVVAPVDRQRAGDQRPGDGGEATDLGGGRAVAEQLLGLVPAAELVERGGADAAHERGGRRRPTPRPTVPVPKAEHEVDEVVAPPGLDERAPQVDVGARHLGQVAELGRDLARLVQLGDRVVGAPLGRQHQAERRGGPGPRRRGRPPRGPAPPPPRPGAGLVGATRPHQRVRVRLDHPGPRRGGGGCAGTSSTASSYAARASSGRPVRYRYQPRRSCSRPARTRVVGHVRGSPAPRRPASAPGRPAPQRLAASAAAASSSSRSARGGRLGIGGPVPQADAPLEGPVGLGHRERGLGGAAGPHRRAEGGVEVSGPGPVAGEAGPPLVGRHAAASDRWRSARARGVGARAAGAARRGARRPAPPRAPGRGGTGTLPRRWSATRRPDLDAGRAGRGRARAAGGRRPPAGARPPSASRSCSTSRPPTAQARSTAAAPAGIRSTRLTTASRRCGGIGAPGSSASPAASSSTNSGLPSDRSTTLATTSGDGGVAQQGAQQLGDVARPEPAELEVAGAPAGQLGRELAQRVPGRDVLAAVGADGAAPAARGCCWR